MDTYYSLYNPNASNGKGEEKARRLDEVIDNGKIIYSDITKIEDIESFFKGCDEETKIIICGGDGTLNNLINKTDISKTDREIYYFSTGSGNDFLRDIKDNTTEEIIPIKKYLLNLPTVKVKNRKYVFLNNVSFGIDGYCCEEADKQRSKKGKHSSYSLLAIKGLLGGYKTRNATIIVDGKKKDYKKVWLAPTMNGRFFGGGLMSAPNQNRLNEKHTVSIVVMYGSSRLKSLLVFPSLFSGNHIKRKEMIEVIEGHNISVRFDKPAAVQIDGETITDVVRYDVISN